MDEIVSERLILLPGSSIFSIVLVVSATEVDDTIGVVFNGGVGCIFVVVTCSVVDCLTEGSSLFFSSD